jgi:hypothetical protein
MSMKLSKYFSFTDMHDQTRLLENMEMWKCTSGRQKWPSFSTRSDLMNERNRCWPVDCC